IDPRLNRSCTGFTSSNFDQLFSNWYVTEDKYLIEEQIQNDDVKVTSPVNFISNISLKKRMSKQEHDKLLLTLHNFKIELFLSYVDMKFEAALINSSISWYKLASYTIEEKNGILSKVHLHLGDFITIYEEDHKESYAIIKGIFQHKGNNNKYYAFIVVDWFEDSRRAGSGGYDFDYNCLGSCDIKKLTCIIINDSQQKDLKYDLYWDGKKVDRYIRKFIDNLCESALEVA
ncbi:hypothetical protein RhiirA4_462342, partial [Rhizophagus irregularis]